MSEDSTPKAKLRPRCEPEYLLLHQAADIAAISKRTLERCIERGTGPRVTRLGSGERKALRISRAALDEWLNRCSQHGNAA